MARVRIAVIADIHGNHAALDSVLTDARRVGVDRIAVLGDIVNGGPEPERCWIAVRAVADILVRGNHERYVLAAAEGDSQFTAEAFGPARWTAGRLAPAELAEIAALPIAVEVADTPAPPAMFTHASPRADDDLILPDTSPEEIEPMLAGTRQGVVVRGHNHVAFDRWVAGVRVIAVGSVGLPFSIPPRAEYSVLDTTTKTWSVERRRVDYDVAATLRACRTTGYLDEAGPVARLFAAEIATGEKFLSPFMRGFYDPARHASLSAAVDLFLAQRRN